MKIGISTAVQKRMASLQNSNPYPLELLGLHRGGRQEEEGLHEIFSDYKIRGEWFEPCEPLLEIADYGSRVIPVSDAIWLRMKRGDGNKVLVVEKFTHEEIFEFDNPKAAEMFYRAANGKSRARLDLIRAEIAGIT